MENFLEGSEQELVFVRLQLEVLKNAHQTVLKLHNETVLVLKSHIEEFDRFNKILKKNENAMQAVMDAQEKIINKQAIEIENLKKAVIFRSLN